MSEQSGWVESALGATAEAVATKAAIAGKSFIVDSVDASSVGSAESLLLQIKDGTTVIWSGYVHGSRNVAFPKGLTITKGALASATFAAGAGATTVNLHGRTRG